MFKSYISENIANVEKEEISTYENTENVAKVEISISDSYCTKI